MKGRKPIPNSIKRLAGDGIHDSGGRDIPEEPQPIQGAPDAPEELTGNALLAWHSFISDTEGMNVVTHADRAALILLCQQYAIMQDAHANLQKTGAIIKLPNGIPAQTPYLKVYREATAVVLKLLAEFGLTPSSRSRIRIAPPETEDDEFMELR